MSNLVEQVIRKDFDAANQTLEEMFKVILERKMCEMKKKASAKMAECDQDGQTDQTFYRTKNEKRVDQGVVEDTENLQETTPEQARAEALDDDISESRIAVVKARIRGGKIQRRKKVSNVPGMTIRGGKLVRMSPAERRHRKMAAKKAARKERGKRAQINRKRKLSLMKRRRLGL